MSTIPSPNLIVLGAQKSGTTTLHHYLQGHPDIHMSRPIKEPGYFLDDEVIRTHYLGDRHASLRREALLDEYMSRGYRGEPYFGDSSTAYTLGTRARRLEIPQRIRREVPDAKLVYIVRNPWARIVSAFLHELGKGRGAGNINGFLNSPGGHQAIRTSHYASQIAAYLEHFPRSQIQILLFEDLVERGEESMQPLWAFLDLPPTRLGRPRQLNRSTNRADVDPADLLFSPAWYNRLAATLVEDAQSLLRLADRDTDTWDLGERWRRPVATG